MTIPGELLTTAMAVMPHKNVDRALKMALSLDVPFWPQLPRYSYYEDMYVQASEHFPGILLDTEKRTLRFSMEKFIDEFEATMAHFDEPGYLDVSDAYSVVYPRFLQLDLSDRPAIRGQMEGPVSFGFNVLDQDDRPILFDDTIRPFLLEFMAKRVNAQLARLKAVNPNAFMFIDEPGLQFIFSALSGYSEQAARPDMENFFSMEVFAHYSEPIRRFLDRGGVLVWGIVPTNFEPFENEDLDSMANRLEEMWTILGKKGIDREFLLSRSMLSPATCCLVNPDGEKTVEKAFGITKKLSTRLREKYRL